MGVWYSLFSLCTFNHFRNADLETYVQEIAEFQNQPKKNLLLVNKADLLTPKQRMAWAKELDSKGISYVFYSAALANQ